MKGIEMPHFFSPRVLRTLKWIFILTAALTVILFVGGSVLSSYITKEARFRFEEAGGKFENLDVNLFTRSIAIQNIEFVDKGDSNSVVATTADLESIVLKNISIYQLVAKNALSIGDLLISEGNVTINRAILPEDSIASENEEALSRINIDLIKFSNVKVSVVNDTSKEFSAIINGTLTELKSSDTAAVADLNAYTLRDLDVRMTKVTSELQFYSIQIASINASSYHRELVIDSLQLIPNYSKFNFAQVVGKQTDRINTFIPKLAIEGLHYNKVRHNSLVASKIRINDAEVHSFRDKREPFRETEVKPLPIAALKRLDFGVEVDTIEIGNLKVTYEEFAPEGFEGGTVVFEELNATLSNIRNRNETANPEHATLTASAKLMGHGLINATFKLPYREGEPYLAEGKIGKMSLDLLNPPLQNLAFIRVQSGTLQGLAFNFSYTDKSSTGRVTINYEELKIESLKKEKSIEINNLKTFLINTVLKNDKNKEVPIHERTGKVDFERDRKRQIFNYWWKSLFSGIKSSIMDR